jgi:hypothetical protein
VTCGQNTIIMGRRRPRIHIPLSHICQVLKFSISKGICIFDTVWHLLEYRVKYSLHLKDLRFLYSLLSREKKRVDLSTKNVDFALKGLKLKLLRLDLLIYQRLTMLSRHPALYWNDQSPDAFTLQRTPYASHFTQAAPRTNRVGNSSSDIGSATRQIPLGCILSDFSFGNSAVFRRKDVKVKTNPCCRYLVCKILLGYKSENSLLCFYMLDFSFSLEFVSCAPKERFRH